VVNLEQSLLPGIIDNTIEMTSLKMAG
jgi:hypothetical protein